MNCKEKTIKYLKNSLYPIPAELNEIDWKSGLPPKTDLLAKHFCTFVNPEGSGFLVYRVNEDPAMFYRIKEQCNKKFRLRHQPIRRRAPAGQISPKETIARQSIEKINSFDKSVI